MREKIIHKGRRSESLSEKDHKKWKKIRIYDKENDKKW